MKTIRYLFIPLVLAIGLATMPRPALADEYDESQSHPLRLAAYVLHPFGLLMEWVIARPIHAFVSDPKLEHVFGHKPHGSILMRGSYPGPMLSGTPAPERPAPKQVARQEPLAERVLVRRVVVEKPIIKEVARIVEVEKVVFPDVAFRFDSAELTELGRGKVYLAAQKLKDRSNIVVEIEGHADHIGSEEYNLKLGLRRAETVKAALGQLGIDPDRISLVSLGESKPVIDQNTGWARAVNRRVEFRVNHH